MPLTHLELPPGAVFLPAGVRALLGEADHRIEHFQQATHFPAFVPSDFRGAYTALTEAARVAPGNRFCEWGSGFGVVTCLAALLDLDAWGIEIEGELVAAARQLADDFGLPAQFVRGSFIPPGGDRCLDDEYSWLSTDESRTYEQLDLGVDDFDVIFAYPWPDEEEMTAKLFDRFAAFGAVLVTYHGGEDFRLRRKVRKRSGRLPIRP